MLVGSNYTVSSSVYSYSPVLAAHLLHPVPGQAVQDESVEAVLAARLASVPLTAQPPAGASLARLLSVQQGDFLLQGYEVTDDLVHGFELLLASNVIFRLINYSTLSYHLQNVDDVISLLDSF